MDADEASLPPIPCEHEHNKKDVAVERRRETIRRRRVGEAHEGVDEFSMYEVVQMAERKAGVSQRATIEESSCACVQRDSCGHGDADGKEKKEDRRYRRGER